MINAIWNYTDTIDETIDEIQKDNIKIWACTNTIDETIKKIQNDMARHFKQLDMSMSIPISDDIEEDYKPYLNEITEYYQCYHTPRPKMITNELAYKCFFGGMFKNHDEFDDIYQNFMNRRSWQYD